MSREFVLAWSFVAVVCAADASFAWRHRETFACWEGNALALALHAWVGVAGVLAYKVASVAAVFVWASLQGEGRVRRVLTAVALYLHCLVVASYALGRVVP